MDRIRSTQPRSADELFAAAWPNERALRDAARARVYMALSRLRKLGVGSRLERVDDGYLLRDVAEIVTVADDAARE